MLGNFASLFFNAARQITSPATILQRQIHTGWLTKNLFNSETSSTTGGSWAMIPIRNKMRWHFPYPREHIRITRYGWAKRMTTNEGRRVLMRRILKGRYILSH